MLTNKQTNKQTAMETVSPTKVAEVTTTQQATTNLFIRRFKRWVGRYINFTPITPRLSHWHWLIFIISCEPLMFHINMEVFEIFVVISCVGLPVGSLFSISVGDFHPLCNLAITFQHGGYILCYQRLFQSHTRLLHVRYMLSPVRVSHLSVCLFVTFVHTTQPVEIFGNVCTPFGTLAIRRST